MLGKLRGKLQIPLSLRMVRYRLQTHLARNILNTSFAATAVGSWNIEILFRCGWSAATAERRTATVDAATALPAKSTRWIQCA